MKFIKLLSALFFSASCVFSATAHEGHQHNPQDDFFNSISQLCGNTYYGESVFPADPGDDFRGKKLTVIIESCTDTEIRMPFHVGENTSRTWILTKTAKGLLFKHDHRHADGTPDEVTMYGGYADKNGSASEQHFPADEFTAELLPKAATNVWTMRFDKANNRFVYHLTRHNTPRYTAHINLTK